MMRKERAKQFMSFDAVKGLAEAIAVREERHSRTERHTISAEDEEQNTRVISNLKKGMKVTVDFWCEFHDVTKEGTVTSFSFVYKFLKLDGKKINFEDIYKIKILEYR